MLCVSCTTTRTVFPTDERYYERYISHGHRGRATPTIEQYYDRTSDVNVNERILNYSSVLSYHFKRHSSRTLKRCMVFHLLLQVINSIYSLHMCYT